MYELTFLVESLRYFIEPPSQSGHVLVLGYRHLIQTMKQLVLLTGNWGGGGVQQASIKGRKHFLTVTYYKIV